MENAVATVPAPSGTPLTPLNPALPAAAPNGFGRRLAALPTRSKWLAAIGGIAVIALLVMAGLGARQGDYRVLFANLSERDGGPIIEKLAQMSVPYRFAEGSGTILVPAEKVHELRLKLSAAGLPKGSITGYELLDKTPFGQTQSQEHSNQKRALEGELTRTIQSLGSVHSARVHLALPQQNGFFREQQKPSASVVLNLHPGRTLDATQLAGIVHLVSSSVPELAPKAVSVLDGNGALLTHLPEQTTSQGLDAQQVQYLRDVEATHLKRVLQLLEPVVGRENLRATVTADIDFSQTESTAEEFKPNQGDAPAAVRAVRSEESSSGGSSTPAGVPGALSNQPPTAAAAPINGASQALRGAQAGAAGGNGRRESETRYEVDKKVSVTRQATGVVKRLNAAVVVNHKTTKDAKGKATSMPLSSEELGKLTALVEQGIGFNKERGDSVRVINAPFHTEAVAPIEPTPWWKEPWLMDLARQGAMPAALALVGLTLVLGVIRPALKPAFTPTAPPEKSGLVDEVVADDNALPLPDGSGKRPALSAPVDAQSLDQVRDLARQNPAAVANVLRGWVSGNQG